MTNIIAKGGNGIYTPAAGAENLHLYNVTIADNSGAVPSAVQVDGKENGQTAAFNRLVEFINVLISGSQQGIASDEGGKVTLQKTLIASDVATPLSGLTAGQNLTGTVLSGAAGYVGGGDYHLTSTSAARDAGSPVNGVTVDLDGAPRPQNNSFDIGAYEFVSAKVNQTISFPLIGDKLLNQSPVTLVATETSGLPVSFSSQTPTVCTVSNATVSLIATGACTIVAEQAGNVAFNPAPAVSQSFQVTLQPNPASHRLFLPLVTRSATS